MSFFGRYTGPTPWDRELQPNQVAWHRDFHESMMARIQHMAARVRNPIKEVTLADVGPHLHLWMSDTRTLRSAWDYLKRHGGQAPGIDGTRFGDLPEGSIWPLLRDIKKNLRAGTYQPDKDRIATIPKIGGGVRRIAVQSVFDRTVGRAAVCVLQPFLEPLFSKFSFGFRPRLGAWDALAVAEYFVVQEKTRAGVFTDIVTAFDAVPFQRLRQVVQKHLPQSQIADIIATIAQDPETGGLRQGNPLSPLLLNLYLHHVLDRPWRRRNPAIPLLRYADDVLILCRSESVAATAYDSLSEIMRPTGMKLHGGRSDCVVTLDPQHAQRWLGYRITALEDGLAFAIDDQSWDSLSEHLYSAHFADAAPQRAVEVIHGWLNYIGPCYSADAVSATWKKLDEVARQFGFAETLSENEMSAFWQRAYARWRRKRKEWRTRLEKQEASSSKV